MYIIYVHCTPNKMHLSTVCFNIIHKVIHDDDVTICDVPIDMWVMHTFDFFSRTIYT